MDAVLGGGGVSRRAVDSKSHSDPIANERYGGVGIGAALQGAT
jgi:hypothetical protein